MTIKTILAISNLQKTIFKMKSSEQDLWENNPHRIDLIKSLQDSILDLEESMMIFKEVIDELRIENKSNFRNHHIALLKTKELDSLKELVKNTQMNL